MKQLAVFLSCILLILLILCQFLPTEEGQRALDAADTDATETGSENFLTGETLESIGTDTTGETVEPTNNMQPQPEPAMDDFVRVKDYIWNVKECLLYATNDNFTGVKIYDFQEAYLRYGTVLKLAEVANQLSELGYGLVIWDGYRPYYAQEKLWQICPDPTYVSKPGTGSQSHCRGIAVDVTLYDLETSQFLEMPTDFDDFSSLADRDYSDSTEKAAENAVMLETIMISCGFKPYSAEWWHYSDTDTYPVEYKFDPAKIH